MKTLKEFLDENDIDLRAFYLNSEQVWVVDFGAYGLCFGKNALVVQPIEARDKYLHQALIKLCALVSGKLLAKHWGVSGLKKFVHVPQLVLGTFYGYVSQTDINNPTES